MTSIKSSICAAIALTFAAGSVLPVAAAPAFAPNASQSLDRGLIEVQMKRDERKRRFERNNDRRDGRDGRFERRGGNYFYNGHRGYRDRRAGYRYYNGYWFAPGAFIAGAIIGGAMNAQPSSSYGSAHVRWCNDRYRTYRSSDNTYMSTAGYRKACNSPYN
jgi:hypothetical protein